MKAIYKNPTYNVSFSYLHFKFLLLIKTVYTKSKAILNFDTFTDHKKV